MAGGEPSQERDAPVEGWGLNMSGADATNLALRRAGSGSSSPSSATALGRRTGSLIRNRLTSNNASKATTETALASNFRELTEIPQL